MSLGSFRRNEYQLLPDLFGEHYVPDPYGLNNERAESSWAYFREVVMHRRPCLPIPGAYVPERSLKRFSQNSAVKLPSGTTLRRATKKALEHPKNCCKGESIEQDEPSGYPHVLRSDEETALKETATGPGYFAVGEFEGSLA